MESFHDCAIWSGQPLSWDDMDWDVSIFDDLRNIATLESKSNTLSTSENMVCNEQRMKDDSATTKAVRSRSKRFKKKISCQSTSAVAKAPVKLKLYSFPSFDRSDALVYLPSTMARLTNSGDIKQFTRLMKSYCAKDCAVCFDRELDQPIPLQMYLGVVEVGYILYPDMLMCMHATRVVDNQIQATLYYKYTDIPEMHSYIRNVPGVRDNPVHNVVFVGDRKELTVRNFKLHQRPESVKEQICDLLDKNEAFEVYGKERITFTFDPYSKKIVRWHSEITQSCVRHGGVQYDL